MSEKMVTVRLEDLRAVLAKADYMKDRSLIGPVDRMTDAVALMTMNDEVSGNVEHAPSSHKCSSLVIIDSTEHGWVYQCPECFAWVTVKALAVWNSQ